MSESSSEAKRSRASADEWDVCFRERFRLTDLAFVVLEQILCRLDVNDWRNARAACRSLRESATRRTPWLCLRVHGESDVRELVELGDELMEYWRNFGSVKTECRFLEATSFEQLALFVGRCAGVRAVEFQSSPSLTTTRCACWRKAV